MRDKAKKGLILSLALLLGVLSLPRAGVAAPEEKEITPQIIVLGHVGTGIEFAFAGGLASLIRRELGIPTTTMDAHKVLQMNLMRQGKVHLTPATVPERYEAYYGKGLFADKGPVPIRGLFLISDSGYNWITLAKSKLDSIADLKGKRIITLGTSQITKYVAELYFNEYGFSSKDVKWIDCPTYKEMVPNLVDGIGDVLVFPGIAPYAVFSEPDLRYNLKWISTPEKNIEHMIANGMPGLVKGYRKPGIYKGDPNGSYYVGVSNVMSAWAPLPENLVYKVCKIVWDTNKEDVRSYHPSAAQFMRLDQTLNKNVLGACPFHSGAIKYYKEVGAWTNELEALNKKLLAEKGQKE